VIASSATALPPAQLADLGVRRVSVGSALFRAAWGGLWVGGTVSIAPQGVSFTPNRIIGQSTQRWSRSTCPPKTFGR